jgi:hypothetical protein
MFCFKKKKLFLQLILMTLKFHAVTCPFIIRLFSLTKFSEILVYCGQEIGNLFVLQLLSGCLTEGSTVNPP